MSQETSFLLRVMVVQQSAVGPPFKLASQHAWKGVHHMSLVPFDCLSGCCCCCCTAFLGSAAQNFGMTCLVCMVHLAVRKAVVRFRFH